MIFPFPYFSPFSLGAPPELPNLYWDAYSNEERIKKICCEIEAQRQYLDKLCEAVNDLDTRVKALEEKQ